MKKILSLCLIAVLLLATFTVSASDNKFYSGNYQQLEGKVIGVCQLKKISEDEVISDVFYSLEIDTNSIIEFESPIDTLEISDGYKGGDYFFLFEDGNLISSEICTVNYEPAYRMDSNEYTSQDVDLENEVEYISKGATVRFNVPGEYMLTASLGATDGYERINQLNKIEIDGSTFYSPTYINLTITVKGETTSETIYDDNLYYDGSIISVTGITGYDDTRIIMNDYYVAMCTSPVVITAQKDLMNMAVSKLENVDGEWKEVRFLDGEGINLGDTTKNWIPGMGFEHLAMTDPHFEYTGSGEFVDGFVPVSKGTSASFAEPGIYNVWAETNSGEFTALTFEIGDAKAKYTDSKVLVDGKEVKFEAYNINDNNYFKLRDIAYVLTTYGEGYNVFNVKWDEERNMISLLTEQEYDAVGGELKEGDGKDKTYSVSSSALMKDGINVTLKAYNINDNNYFKLRDLGKLFNFNVSWDGNNNCILIDSTAPYVE